MMRKRYSVSRRGLVLLRRYILFIIELLISKELFHQSSFYLNKVHFVYPASTLPRTISSKQVLLSQEFFHQSSSYLSKVLFSIHLLLSKEHASSVRYLLLFFNYGYN